MNARTRREALAWARAAVVTLTGVAVLGLLALAGAYTAGLI